MRGAAPGSGDCHAGYGFDFHLCRNQRYGCCLGFSVFADILLVFGLALAAAAIGLLLLWTFIWFLAGAIPGVIRGIVGLGRKLCYKEVSA